MKAYTYLIGWSEKNLWYYGVRYKEGCSTDDLWKTYFTSSKLVHKMRKLLGEPNVIQIRKIFDCVNEAIRWEYRFLTKIDASNLDNFLNLQNGSGKIAPSKNQIINDMVSDKMKEYWTEDRRKIKSENMKKYYADNPAEKDRISKSSKENWSKKTEDERVSFSEKMKAVNLEKKEKIRLGLKKVWESQEFRNRMKDRNHGSNSDALKEKWKDPVWRNKMLEARRLKKEQKHETN